MPLYIGSEDVTGVVHIKRTKGKKIDIEHNGIKIEVSCVWGERARLTGGVPQLIGQIEMFQDRGNLFQFVTLEKDLAPAGRLDDEISWNFDFKQVRGRCAHVMAAD